MNTLYRDITTVKTNLTSKLSPLFLLLLAMLMLPACSSDDEQAVDQLKPVNVRMVFVAGAANGSMRALSEDEGTTSIKKEMVIRDLTVAIFDNTDLVIGYYSGATTSATAAVQTINITTHAATGCTVYAIANAGVGYFANCTTKAAYDAKKTSDPLLTSAADLGEANQAIMFGKATGQTIVEGANIGPIQMEHVCSKVNLVVKPDNTKNIKVTGWQLHHVPNGAYITDANTEAWGESFLDFTAVTGQEYTNETTVATYYLYQNYAGKNAASNSDENRNYQNAPATASYITVNAQTLAWQSVFRIYLGGKKLTEATDDYTDFNVYRNHNYTVTVEINGSNSTDVRITHTDIAPITFTATVTELTNDPRSLTFY